MNNLPNMESILLFLKKQITNKLVISHIQRNLLPRIKTKIVVKSHESQKNCGS